MSDDSKIDADKALAAVNARTWAVPCPLCRNTDWLAEGGLGILGAPRPAYLVTDLDRFWEGPPAIPVLVFTCTNCGFIRLHNIAYMQNRDRP